MMMIVLIGFQSNVIDGCQPIKAHKAISNQAQLGPVSITFMIHLLFANSNPITSGPNQCGWKMPLSMTIGPSKVLVTIHGIRGTFF